MPSENSSKKILIVEDDIIALDCLVFCLEDEGYSVSSATSIKDAREKAAEHRPDVVISDLSLSDGWGHDLIKELKGSQDFTCIALTGYQSENIEQGVFDHFLTKPVDFSKLLSLLQTV